MDKKVEGDGHVYTHWEGMDWPPIHSKSTTLELHETSLNVSSDESTRTFIYTDEGYRRLGVWARTESIWTKGRCIIEFKRVCDNPSKARDLEAASGTGLNIHENGLLIQDTDLVRGSNHTTLRENFPCMSPTI